MTTNPTVTAALQPLREDADQWAEAKCGLAGCGKTLHMVWTSDRAIYLADSVVDLAAAENAHTSSWHVECEGGHTVLVPVDTAADNYEFGKCAEHDGDEPHDEYCEATDLARLRAILDPVAAVATVEEGWWHPNVKSGQVHDHTSVQPQTMHRLCVPVYTRRDTRR